jgi:tetratricopeptide (TPR) repeat protein
LPLALRLVAAGLASEPEPDVRSHIERLRTAPLDRLRLPDDDGSDVRAAFDLSYRRLSTTARTGFRRLGLFPGAELCAHAAAALIGVPDADGRRVVAELVHACLVDETVNDRLTLHDLLREYARERGAAEDDPPDIRAAADRLIGWYLSTATAANAVLTPHHRAVVRAVPDPAPEPLAGANREQVVALLVREVGNLPAVMRFTIERRQLEEAWQMAYLFAGFLNLGTDVPSALEVTRLGLTAAEMLGDPDAERIMGNTYAAMCNVACLPSQALDRLRDVISLARRTGSAAGEASAQNNSGRALRQLGRPGEAIEAYQRALALYTRLGDPDGIGMVLNNLGNAYAHLGQYERAKQCLHQALAQWQRLDSVHGRTLTLNSLGELYGRTGEFAAAERVMAESLVLSRRHCQREQEIDALAQLGRTAARRRRYRDAMLHLDLALQLCRQSQSGGQEIAVRSALAHVHLDRGDIASAATQLATLAPLAGTNADPYRAAEVSRALARVAVARGEPGAADAYRRQATELYRRAGAVAEAALTQAAMTGDRTLETAG